MPELPEVEGYRALAERGALRRAIAAVDAPDAWYLKRGLVAEAARSALEGRQLLAARRRGKLLLLDAGFAADEPDVVLGLHFGMSGRLILDGQASAERLLYGPAGADVRYDRFTLHFADGGWLAMRDVRRLGAVELDPDEARLGPDALSATMPDLRRALAGSSVALKARLMDQSRLAGVGNLIADEVLWRAGLAPGRPASSLTGNELRRLHRHLTGGIADLISRGGSHTGDLQPQRRPGGVCPRDHAGLNRGVVGGRTTWWCPRHQH
jgi:formamidopyrimidine-DNA glycosylase